MKLHQVVTVDDTDLPDDHDWAIVDLPDRVLFIMKASADQAQATADGWAAYRIVADGRHASRAALRAVV